MSVTNTSNVVREQGNGSKTVFSFSFKIFAASELEVYSVVRATDVATLKTISTHYTVQISTTGEGGTVTWLAAPSSLQDSLIRRVVPYSQDADIPTESNFPEDQIENQLDRLCMMCIQLKEITDRCVQVGVAETGISTQALIDAVTDATDAADDAAASAVAAAASASAASSSASGSASSASASASSAAAAAASAASVPSTASILATIYPVGSIYINAGVATNPATLFGFGTWAAYATGKMIIGLNSGDADFDALADTGGAKTATIALANLPSATIAGTRYDGNGSGSTGIQGTTNGANATAFTLPLGGSDTALNIMNPYVVAYMWKRTA